MYPYQQYGSAPAGMGNPDMMGGMGGMPNRPTNKMASPYSAPTGGETPLPYEDSGPVTFSTRPMRIKNPAPTQSNDIAYTGGSRDFDETTGTYRSEDGRGPMMMSPAVMPKDFDGTTPANPRQMRLQQLARPTDDGYNQQRQQMNPFMGGQGFNPMGSGFNPMGSGFNPMGGGFGGYGQQMQNPFIGGGGFGGGFGGFGQQMQNPFMGGQGFNPMGGGFGGFGQQMQNPFMGGQGFNPMGGGFGGFGGFGQQMQNPFMGGNGFGQQMQQPMQQMQPLQRMAGPAPQQAQPQQQQSPMAPMGYQGGAF